MRAAVALFTPLSLGAVVSAAQPENQPKVKSETQETARKERVQKHQGNNKKKAADSAASQKNK
jgi:hypothetical protein